ncbi:MAG: thiolase family protein [Acidimicrobiia bacterium]
MAYTVITGAKRTPLGKRGGALSRVHPAELLGSLIAATLEEIALDPGAVDQVLAGCVAPVGDQGYNVGRMAWLAAGLPYEIPAATLDAQCGSSHQAVNIAASLIAAGQADHVVVGGVELMSRHPLGSSVAGGEGEPMGAAYREHYEMIDQGESAERIADHWEIGRSECDEIGLRSQHLAAEARDNGRFDDELWPVDLPTANRESPRVCIDADETPRHTTREALAELSPVFRRDGCHTAGNSSQISDGASCIVISSATAAERDGLIHLAAIEHQAFVGVDPVLKLTGPIPATIKALDRGGLSTREIHRWEVNEAFASVIGAWTREVAVDVDRINLNGGAIALGHPVGATGARLIATAVHQLRHRGTGRALVAMCCGGGLGTATILGVEG